MSPSHPARSARRSLPLLLALLPAAAGCGGTLADVLSRPLIPPGPPSYHAYDDIAIDGARATGKTALLSMKRISVQPGVVQGSPCGGRPQLLWVMLHFRDDQREIVRALGDDDCKDVSFVIGARDSLGVLHGDLVAVAPPRPVDAPAPAPGPTAWVDQTDPALGISFSMPAAPARSARGYALTTAAARYAVEVVNVPEGAADAQAIDRYLPAVLASNGGRLVDSKPVSLGGREGRDVIVQMPQRDDAGNEVQAFIRFVQVPERRFLLVASAIVSSATRSSADLPRFFASVQVR